jgi:hypothetical protein
MHILDDILQREIERINEVSKKGPLETDEVKRLEILVRAYKQYSAPAVEDDSPLAGLSSEDLLAFIKGEDIPPEPKPAKKAKKSK